MVILALEAAFGTIIDLGLLGMLYKISKVKSQTSDSRDSQYLKEELIYIFGDGEVAQGEEEYQRIQDEMMRKRYQEFVEETYNNRISEILEGLLTLSRTSDVH